MANIEDYNGIKNPDLYEEIIKYFIREASVETLRNYGINIPNQKLSTLSTTKLFNILKDVYQAKTGNKLISIYSTKFVADGDARQQIKHEDAQKMLSKGFSVFDKVSIFYRLDAGISPDSSIRRQTLTPEFNVQQPQVQTHQITK